MKSIPPEKLVIWAMFVLLAGWTALSSERRNNALKRSFPQWGLDAAGLSIQGTLVPVFQTLVIFAMLSLLLPQYKGILDLPAPIAFLFNFVLIDYFYYWNHRLLHRAAIWRFHSVHHSGETLDVFATSRNSAITIFLILYVWVNGPILFLLKNPAPFVWGIALSNCLDLLRHSRMEAWPAFFPFNLIISPREHAWHHSRDQYGINFGANWNIWDRVHGTYHAAEKLPERVGAEIQERSLWKAFWTGTL